MKPTIKVIFIESADKEFKKLNEIVGKQKLAGQQNTFEMQLLKSINQKIEFLKTNPFYGNNIEKRKIPENYQVNNLWRVELTGHWRMLYFIRRDSIEIVCFVLDILNHNNYNKKFGYKKR
jgi:mRNA-degrading endonuclease RelE of RelBE toxin-antitoxin system